MPPYTAHDHNLPQPLCTSPRSHTGQKTQLAATSATHQGEASDPDQHPHKAYGLNLRRLPTGLEAPIYCRHPPSHHNWLPSLVVPPYDATFLKEIG